jgi:hypothetical protein
MSSEARLLCDMLPRPSTAASAALSGMAMRSSARYCSRPARQTIGEDWAGKRPRFAHRGIVALGRNELAQAFQSALRRWNKDIVVRPTAMRARSQTRVTHSHVRRQPELGVPVFRVLAKVVDASHCVPPVPPAPQ